MAQEATSTMNKKKNKFTIGKFLNYFFLTVLAFICLYPFLNVVAYSFSGYNAVLSGKVTFYPVDISLTAYQTIMKNSQIWSAMWVTIFTTIMGTLIGLILTIAAAYALSRDYLPGKGILSGLILFTMYFSGGIIPTFLVVKGLGMYDSLTSLFIPQAVNVFNFIVMRTFFRQLPTELEEAARIDGANEMQILFKIILPLSIPIIATIGLFYAVNYWNSYFDALIYITSPDKFTLQLRLRNLLFADELANAGGNGEGIGTQVMSQSLKMCCVVVATLPIICVYPWLQKYFVKGVMLGSVKG